MKKFTLALLCLLFSVRLFASHVSNADIRYEYTGVGDLYRVYLTAVKVCEPNAASLGLTADVEFNSACGSFNRLLPAVSIDTFGHFCPGSMGSCNMPGSVFPQFIRHIYVDTVTLTACSDWKISWQLCCRTTGVVNLLTPGSDNIYVEAFLNNSTAVNSSPIVANPPHALVATGFLTSTPIQAVDPEHDSIVYELYQPGNTATSAATYAPGYSFALPLGTGSSVTVNVPAQTLDITAMFSGKFTLALRIKDYRNGQLVGYSSRDFMVLSMNGTAAPTTPMLATGSNTHIVTCPGQSHSLTYTFNDSPSDSVNLTVTTPTIPGFTFSQSVTPGVGSATATVSWTTPASYDPATMPYFYILFDAHDNACPASNSGLYNVAILGTQCSTDSVWAGDANGDYTVNVYDPLAVAVAYGTTGSTRPGATTTWQAEYCPNWTDTFMNSVNMKHADCNGDGVVDASDLGAVNSNWGSVHLKGTPRGKTTAVPDLWLDVSNISFHPGATVNIPVKLGSATYPMNDFYGVATDMSITGVTLPSPASISHSTSWVGSSTNTLAFAKADATGNLSWAYARTDHQNVNGQGTIGMLQLTIPANATVGSQLNFSFANTRIIDKDMNELTGFNVIDTMVLITPLSVGSVERNITLAQVVPNPSRGSATLQVQTRVASQLSVRVQDVSGKTVSLMQYSVSQGANELSLPAAELSSGFYLIQLVDAEGNQQSLKWIKE